VALVNPGPIRPAWCRCRHCATNTDRDLWAPVQDIGGGATEKTRNSQPQIRSFEDWARAMACGIPNFCATPGTWPLCLAEAVPYFPQ